MPTASTGSQSSDLLCCFSAATDLAIGQEVGFGLKAAVIGLRLGKMLNLPDAILDDFCTYTLVSHVGCHAETATISAVFGNEHSFHRRLTLIDHGKPRELVSALVSQVLEVRKDDHTLGRIGAVVQMLAMVKGLGTEIQLGHCDVARHLAMRMKLKVTIVEALGQVSERWDGKGLASGLRGENISILCRLGAVSQGLLWLQAVAPIEQVATTMFKRSGGFYDPAMARLAAQKAGELLRDLEVEACRREVLGRVASDGDDATVDAICLAMGDFVDMKHPARAGHSRKLAELTMAAAQLHGLGKDDVQLLQRASWLHDLGMAAVPSGNTDAARLHPYHGEALIKFSNAFSAVARLVGEHHEMLDGSGYYRGRRKSELGFSVRLLAAAEVYQEMLVENPSPQRASAELQRLGRDGKLDAQAVVAVLGAAGLNVRRQTNVGSDGLTQREKEVLSAIAAGLSIKEIARKLSIAPKTADNHVQSIYSKCGVRSRAAAALVAVEMGLAGL